MTPHRRTIAPTVALAGLLAGLAAACASTPDPAAGARPGCYYFERDPVATALRLPWGIRLEEAPLEGWPAMESREARKATTLTATEERDHPFGYWVATATDSLEIGYPAGGGLVLELAQRADGGLEGDAVPVGDAVAPGATASPGRHPVRLVWARCPEG